MAQISNISCYSSYLFNHEEHEGFTKYSFSLRRVVASLRESDLTIRIAEPLREINNYKFSLFGGKWIPAFAGMTV